MPPGEAEGEATYYSGCFVGYFRNLGGILVALRGFGVSRFFEGDVH